MLKKALMIFFIIASFAQAIPAQEKECSKPKVAVKGNFPYKKGLIEYLGNRNPLQPRGAWLGKIQENVLAELRMNSPDIQFITADEMSAADCDYEFRYGVVPYGDGLQMDSNLIQKNACGFPGNSLGAKNTIDTDLLRMVERNIDAHGSISQRIKEREESSRVPARGPEMNISLRKEFVSPIKEEREMEIRIGVKNCRGEPVYDPYHGQQVILPKHTKRGELHCTKGTPEKCRSFDSILLLEITSPAGASATYRLKKGMDASEDSLKIKTCGIDRAVLKEISVPIYGMQIEAKAKDQVISPGESTSIEVFLYKITLQGERIPVANQTIEVTVRGLVDGSLSPRGKVATNETGKVILKYRAGEKEKRIDIHTQYQPEGYPDFITTQTHVEVEPQKYNGLLQFNYLFRGSKTNLETTINIGLGKPTHSVPIDLKGNRQEYYPVLNKTIIKAKAWDAEKGEGSVFAFFPPLSWEKIKLWPVVTHSKTGKVVALVVPGWFLEFKWADGDEGYMGQDCLEEEFGKVNKGDGLRNAEGSCTRNIDDDGIEMIHWKLQRY